MKFSDLDQLTEAPDLSSIKGKLQRAGTKLAKHTPFSKKTRTKATAKSGVQKTGLKIKDKFHTWQGETGEDDTVEAFKSFLSSELPQYAPYVDNIAVALKLAKPKPKPESDIQKQVPTDDINYSVELDKSGAPKKDAKSEQYSDKEKGALRKQEGDAAKAEAKELDSENPKHDLKASKGNEEPKVDMSASIYEGRLSYFLIEKTKLSDNQLDTLIVRVIQAANKASTASNEPAQDEPAPREKPSNEIGKAAKKISKAKADDEEEFTVASPASSGGSVFDEFADELEDILTTVYKGKDITDNQKRYAKAILDEL
jgi:hypothetical protein